MRSFITPAIVAMLAATSMMGVQAQTQNLKAANSSTVRPAGPRTTGTPPVNETRYLNAEGNGVTNPTVNASFGIIDFTPTANPTATSISNLVLSLTEFNASFTAPGTFNIYLASNTGSPANFKFDSTQLGTGGIGTQLGQLFLLGTGTFSSMGATPTGKVDPFNLTLNSQDARNLFLSDVNSGSAIRIALGATTDTTAATFGGFTSMIGPAGSQVSGAPTLTFNATSSAPVPEASTTASFGLLLVLGLGGIVVARRRKQANMQA